MFFSVVCRMACQPFPMNRDDVHMDASAKHEFCCALPHRNGPTDMTLDFWTDNGNFGAWSPRGDI
jgi:hypothetical protein